MKKIYIVLVIILSFSIVNAQDREDSRLKWLVHTSHQLFESGSLTSHIIISPNVLKTPFTPFIYIGYKHNFGNWAIEPAVGRKFAKGKDINIVSVRLHYDSKKWYSWTDIENGNPGQTYYWFSQLNRKVNDFVKIGIEGEGWGNFEDGSYYVGFGPDIIIKFSEHLAIDISYYWYKKSEYIKWHPEINVRLHFFL